MLCGCYDRGTTSNVKTMFWAEVNNIDIGTGIYENVSTSLAVGGILVTTRSKKNKKKKKQSHILNLFPCPQAWWEEAITNFVTGSGAQ